MLQTGQYDKPLFLSALLLVQNYMSVDHCMSPMLRLLVAALNLEVENSKTSRLGNRRTARRQGKRIARPVRLYNTAYPLSSPVSVGSGSAVLDQAYKTIMWSDTATCWDTRHPTLILLRMGKRDTLFFDEMPPEVAFLWLPGNGATISGDACR